MHAGHQLTQKWCRCTARHREMPQIYHCFRPAGHTPDRAQSAWKVSGILGHPLCATVCFACFTRPPWSKRTSVGAVHAIHVLTRPLYRLRWRFLFLQPTAILCGQNNLLQNVRKTKKYAVSYSDVCSCLWNQRTELPQTSKNLDECSCFCHE